VRRYAATRAPFGADPAEEVAQVACARRELLLRVHRHRLRREDLEDCYSQAVVELVAGARGGARFASRVHLARVIEQRFVSRIQDRRRALSGRSPMQAALERGVSLDDLERSQAEIVDLHADPEQLVILRQELRSMRSLIERLSADQRLVLAAQAGLLPLDRGELCRRCGWSSEKYRKVAQRARARLRLLMAAAQADVPLEPVASVEETGTPL
jgi:DNA-directed RNA polymerase specialized sigma24 family protein